MVNLILNENMKLYRRPRTWVMVGLMIVAVLLVSYIEWYYGGKGTQGEIWREAVLQDRQYYAEVLLDPELTEGERAYYQERLVISDYHLDRGIRTIDGTIWNGINGTAELVALITLFTVIIAGDSLAGEFTTGTIKLLLIRPASRLRILVSKYLSMIMFGLLLLVILFFVSLLTNGILYRFEHLDMPLITIDSSGHIVEKNMFNNLGQLYLLNGVSTIIFVTMAFMISAAFRSSTMAIGVSIFALFSGTMLLGLLRHYEWSKYVLFANIDLSRYLYGRPFQEGMTLSFSITMLAIYFVLFNLTSWLVFTKRDVAT